MPDEDDILISYALRFDGYKYQESHPFDKKQAVRDFQRTGEWRISPLEQLTIFFLLQRFLYKWGGEMLPRTSGWWKAFRTLFLLVSGYSIPMQYRHVEWYKKWRRLKPGLADHVALIRYIHESTEYSPNDVFDPETLG